MDWQRRALVTGAMTMIAGSAVAQAATGDAGKARESLALWPARPPGAPPTWAPKADTLMARTMVRAVSQPRLTVHRAEQPNGAAVIILPGGGYGILSIVGEGSAPAAALNAAGITAFVLTYRLPREGWAVPADTPLQDAQRAMRLVRARAAEFGIDPTRLGVLGFSAGGHLASTLATRHAERAYERIDAADAQSARPAFAGLIYPVITMGGDHVEKGSRRNLLGASPAPALVLARSSEQQVDADTAPCFLVHGLNDKVVPAENSLMMLEALRAKRIPCEAHLFQEGMHGFGVGLKRQGNSEWPALFAAWIRRLGAAS